MCFQHPSTFEDFRFAYLVFNLKTQSAWIDGWMAASSSHALLESQVVERQLDTSILSDNLSTGRPRVIPPINHPVPRTGIVIFEDAFHSRRSITQHFVCEIIHEGRA